MPDTGRTRPNIVFILADDLSYADVGFNGQRHIKTPNIDRIAAEGMNFTSAYAAAPICGPSRCGILTGRHMGHAAIREHGQPVPGGAYQHTLSAEDKTVGDVLRGAGYLTAAVGKWAVGLGGTDSIPNNRGFDYSFGFYDQIYAHNFYPPFLWEDGKPYPLPENNGFDMAKRYRYNFSRWDADVGAGNEYGADGRLRVDELADPYGGRNSYDECEKKALEFLDGALGAGNRENKPFFLYYNVQNPHGPLIVPSLEPYADADFPSTRHKEWAAIITRLDGGVGRIMDRLTAAGAYDDTLFIFASDNGYSAWGYFGLPMTESVEFFNHKGDMRGSKFTLDGEAGIRVPLAMSWTGHIPAGTVTDTPVAFYDLMATFADIAGAEDVPENDGLSFLPLLLGGDFKPHAYFYWECGHEQAARFGSIKAYSPHPGKPVQLYDLSADPREERDLAAAMPQTVALARDIFAAEHTHTDIFVNPGEPDEAHKARLASMGLKPNCPACDDPSRLRALEW